jgi:small-conductance mechanosensitive channel
MDIIYSVLESYFTFNEKTQRWLIKMGIEFFIFFSFILLSILGGRYTPKLLKFIIRQLFPKQYTEISLNFLEPLERPLRMAGTFILLFLSLEFIQSYQGVYRFLYFFLNLAVAISVAWLFSRLFKQFVRTYGITLIKKLGREIDELLLVAETIANVVIGFIAVVAFAQNQQINLVGLLASLGIGGIAVAFAAQRTLEQLIGTIVLYLDRPYIPGEYIRVNFNPHDDDVFARVESIGIRSTKLRVAAKSTLIIVPNSIMATKDIENITRGKKVMVLLYLNFLDSLKAKEKALVEQVIKESTDTLFGIDPGSTKIYLFQPEDRQGTRARITFFILGSNDNSLQLRKRLLELANDIISQKLMKYEIKFDMENPTIYVDSPITI